MPLIICKKLFFSTLLVAIFIADSRAQENQGLKAKAIDGSARSGSDIRVIAYYYGGPALLDSFDANKITHFIFCFGQLEGNRFKISKTDTATVQKMVSLKKKNPQLKVIVSLGGGRGCKTCSNAFALKEGRQEFARSMKAFHEYFGTDGLDLDWEFPNIEHFPGQSYSPEDKSNFTRLVREIRKVNPQYELSFAAGAHEGIFETVVEWKNVMKVMDYVNLMTYDIGSYQNRPKLPQYRHLSLGSDSKNTAHHTALFQPPISYTLYQVRIASFQLLVRKDQWMFV